MWQVLTVVNLAVLIVLAGFVWQCHRKTSWLRGDVPTGRVSDVRHYPRPHRHRPEDADILSPQQMLRAVFVEVIEMRLDMADLNQAVSDLQTAVQGVVDRVDPTLEDLRAQVAAGQQALADAAAADQTEDANYEQTIADLRAALEAQVNGAQSAADAIGQSVEALNAIAAPVEQPPVEEPPVEEPPVEEPPAEEQPV